MSIAINCMVLCDTPAEVAKAMEALGRVGAGLALDGQTISISITTFDDEVDPE